MADGIQAEQKSAKAESVAGTLVKRRGLITAAWAAVVGLVAAKATKPVQAVSGGGADGNVVMGSNFLNSINTANTVTIIGPEETTFPVQVVFDVEGAAAGAGGTLPNINASYGHGKGTGCGVMGVVGGPTGTQATRVTLNAGTAGIYAGTADNGIGVYGELPTTVSTNGIAVYGLNNSTHVGPVPGAGGFGVFGHSTRGNGLVGATGTSGGAAVVGATNGVAGAYAGVFYGPMVVSGPFTVVGGPKSAAVPHPDGTHRRLYCLESPESWFEDFGKGQLERGSAEVKIDPDFAVAAITDDYHVFVTPYDQHSELCVTERTPAGFRVLSKDPSGCAAFSWRVVAKRRDIVGERFEKVTLPREPVLPVLQSDAESPNPALSPRRA
jgi:hypothetical protein